MSIAGTFITPAREKKVTFSKQIFRLGNGALIRKGDQRFVTIKSVDDLDRPKFSISVVIGEFSYEYAKSHFKHANLSTIAGADLSLAPFSVLTHRADIAMSDQYILRRFASNHPETEDLLADRPYAVLPIAWSVKKGDQVWINYWNNQITKLDQSGRLEELKSKYDKLIPFVN